MPDVKYVAVVDNSGAIVPIQELDKAWNALHQTGKETPAVMGEAGKAFESLAAQFTAGAIAARMIEGAYSAVKGFVASSIEGAVAEEASQHRLTTAVEMAGRARNLNAKDLLEFAQAQSHVTTYTHEEIEATATLLAQMTKLDNEGIKNMSKGIMGLAAVLGPNEGLEGASMRVMRAIEGNAEGLKRVGIQIDTTLPKHEQLLQIQEKLAAMYPRATAELDTMAGQIKQVNKQWGEFKEAAGTAMIEATRAKDLLPIATEALRGMAEKGNEAEYSWKNLNVQFAAARGLIPPATIQMLAAAEAARKLAADQKTLDDMFDEIERKADRHIKPIFDLGQAFKDLGLKSGAELGEQLKIAQQALDAYMITGNAAPGVVEALVKKMRELEDQVKGANFELDKFGHLVPKGSLDLAPAFKNIEPIIEKVRTGLDKTYSIIGDIISGPLGDLVSGMGEYSGITADGAVQTTKLKTVWEAMTRLEIRGEIKMLTAELDRMTTSGAYTAAELSKIRQAIAAPGKELSTPTWMTAWADKLNDAVSVMTPVVQGFSAIFSQASQNNQIAIENEYKKRLAVINATIKDETKKQAAIVALEAEYQIKRTDAARSAAKGAKAVALMEAIVNTASGVARAFKDYAFPLSAIIAGIVGALGAVQIGLIAAQPIPLAKGAVFTKPTRILGPSGTEYEGGEAGTEILGSEKMIRTIVREETRAMGGGFTFNGPLVQINTTGLSDADIREAGDRLYGEINQQLRRIGRT